MYNLKKGLNIPISGTPEGNISDSTKISHVGILGPDYVGMKPTMMVEIGMEIEVADQENQVEFFNDNNETLICNLSKYGIINYFRTRPFNKTPKPNNVPEDIFVNICDTNPLSVDPCTYLQYEIDLYHLWNL